MLSPINGAAAAPLAAGPAPTAPIAPRAQAPAADKAAVAKTPPQDSPADVESALKTLNQFTAMVAQDVRFTMDEESGKTIVKVVDTATQEVLRQFPSAEALSIARSIDKMQGLLIREKA